MDTRSESPGSQGSAIVSFSRIFHTVSHTVTTPRIWSPSPSMENSAQHAVGSSPGAGVKKDLASCVLILVLLGGLDEQLLVSWPNFTVANTSREAAGKGK